MEGGMNACLIGVILLLLIGAGVMSARLGCYKKQINHMLEELHMLGMEHSDTNMLLTSAVHIGKTEEVIAQVNKVIAVKRQRQEQLLRENRSYRDSITCISHDIRTPLTSAKGYIQMLSDSAVPEAKKKEYARIVERRLNDLADLLDQLFLYARMEAGEFSLDIVSFNASNVFAETVSLFYEDFVKKDCEPHVYIVPKPCRLRADRQAFVRIVENLIKNALVHGTGGYELSIDQEGNQAVLRVANKTESIEQEDMERIFDRFYTTDCSRSRRTTGLGLAIVKELTERMGGAAWACLENGVFSVEIRFDLERV